LKLYKLVTEGHNPSVPELAVIPTTHGTRKQLVQDQLQAPLPTDRRVV
jgi:hypothetical protein